MHCGPSCFWRIKAEPAPRRKSPPPRSYRPSYLLQSHAGAQPCAGQCVAARSSRRFHAGQVARRTECVGCDRSGRSYSADSHVPLGIKAHGTSSARCTGGSMMRLRRSKRRFANRRSAIFCKSRRRASPCAIFRIWLPNAAACQAVLQILSHGHIALDGWHVR